MPFDCISLTYLSNFGPNGQPRLTVGFQNEVNVDSAGYAQLTRVEDYEQSVSKATWNATMKYVNSLKQGEKKIAFFNSTPQGGGVALMRHALIRYLKLVGVEARW